MLQLNAPLQDRQRRFCEYWLRMWKPLEKALVHKPVFQAPSILAMLIQYELETRRRANVLDRLAGRRAKLIRKEETEQMLSFMRTTDPKPVSEIYVKELADEGASNRAVSGGAS